MMHGASSSSAKNIFQKFSNHSNMQLTMCHIPAGIVKMLTIEELSKTMILKDKSSQYIGNIGVLYSIKPISYEFDGTAVETPLKPRQIEYSPPEAWYYTLKPVNKANNA
jgi:hypothetical protein